MDNCRNDFGKLCVASQIDKCKLDRFLIRCLGCNQAQSCASHAVFVDLNQTKVKDLATGRQIDISMSEFPECASRWMLGDDSDFANSS